MSILEKYRKPSNAGAFAVLSNFIKNNKDYKSKLVSNVLFLKENAYTQNFPKKNFQRNKVIVCGIDRSWQADLIDMQNFKS